MVSNQGTNHFNVAIKTIKAATLKKEYMVSMPQKTNSSLVLECVDSSQV
jgi:hypothetical protein